LIGLEEVARPTGEREVGLVVEALSRRWYNVFDFEWQVEDDLWRATVFAAMPSPVGDFGIVLVHLPI